MRVLLLTTATSGSAALREARRRFGDGAQLTAVSWHAIASSSTPGVAVLVLGPARPRPVTGVAGTLPARALRRLVRGGVSRSFWRRFAQDQRAMDLAEAVDVVVSLDTASIRTGWHLARRLGTPAYYGLSAALTLTTSGESPP